jgi:hypothetical protein
VATAAEDTRVDSHHPEYDDRIGDWEMMRHTMRGEKAVKDAREAYLPVPTGFSSQNNGTLGAQLYDAYIVRAQFPTIVQPTLSGLTGIVHRSPANIELPPQMDYLREDATGSGITLDKLHESISAELFLTSRCTILADAPAEGGDPYLTTYTAESLINWDWDQYVLDESGWERVGFEWRWVQRYRVLRLEDETRYIQEMYEAEGENALPEKVDDATPEGVGGRGLDQIPLVVVGARDVSDDPQEIPLIGVASAALAAYRLDADYRHQLFASGQETLFCIGVTQETLPKIVGAGVTVGLPLGADAKYVGPSGRTIEAHRVAIADELQRAVASGAKLLQTDTKSTQRESGEALRLRFSSETATLLDIAKSSAAGLERALRHIARILGLNEELVIVTPNLEFVNARMSPAEAKDLVAAWMQKAISYETLFYNMQRGDLIPPDRTHEDEMEKIEAETPDIALPPPPPPPGGQQPPPQDDPPEEDE